MSRTKTSGGASRKVLAGKAPRKTLGSVTKAPKAKSSRLSKSSKSSKSSKGKIGYRGGNRVPKNMKTPGWQKGIKEFLSVVNHDGAGSSSDVQQSELQNTGTMVEGRDVVEVVEGTCNGQVAEAVMDRSHSTGTSEQDSEEVVSADEMAEAADVATSNHRKQVTTSNTDQSDSMEVTSQEEDSKDNVVDCAVDKVGSSAVGKVDNSMEDMADSSTTDKPDTSSADKQDTSSADKPDNSSADKPDNSSADKPDNSSADSTSNPEVNKDCSSEVIE